MLVAFLIGSIFYVSVQCQLEEPPDIHNDRKLIQCIIGILNKYFGKDRELTYVNIHPYEDELLKSIHSTMNFSLKSRLPTQQMFVPNTGYLVSSANAVSFAKYFEYLRREPTWNPYAIFLIVIKSLQDVELRPVFNELLRLHVNNAVLVNGTDDAHLYTYNPFDNYACGKYYNNVISYGMCSQNTKNLYPNKLVTGLKKCNLRASIANRPPLSADPLRMDNKPLLGSEEYIITLLGKKEQFTVNFNYNYDSDLYSTVLPNMTATGPMDMLQRNESDVIFGGMIMVTPRAEAFAYLCGYHDYIDELRFAVKRSSIIPTWKFIYLEFDLDVWGTLVVTFIIYSNIVAILLRTEDRSEVCLRLLDNLLLHGREVRTRLTVKLVLITWAWFAYLINTFYQSNLFSFTTQPSLEYQVSNEDDIIEYDFQACFSHALRHFIETESNKLSNNLNFIDKGCETTDVVMNTISTTKNMFTMIPNYFYLYNKAKYNDKWGQPLIYYFDKPYTKFLFGYFFYKGFPITRSLQLNALRMRESGLADKILRDHYYLRRLKEKVSHKTFETHFVFPWCIYIPGLVVALVVFIIELLMKHSKWFNFILVRFK